MKRRFFRPIRGASLIFCPAILVLSGCIHMTHPSNVRPGWSADIVAGLGRERYREDSDCASCRAGEPSSGDVSVVQMNMAWGTMLKNGDALRVGLMIPLAMNNGSALGAMGGTTLDFYYQFMKGPFNFGAGGMAGLINSGVYLEAGKTFYPSAGFELDIDAGVSEEIALFHEPGIRPFFLISFAGDRWKVGLWADYLKYPGYLKRCDENCEADDYLDRSVSGGFCLGRRFR